MVICWVNYLINYHYLSYYVREGNCMRANGAASCGMKLTSPSAQSAMRSLVVQCQELAEESGAMRNLVVR